MTATIAEIMDAMADQIRGVIDDVTDVAVQVEPRWVVNPTPPTIDIYPGDPSADQEWRAFGDEIGAEVLTVRARVDLSDSTAGQDILLGLMDAEDPLSITEALAEDKTLGGLASSMDVRQRSGYVRVLEGGDYLGCLWTVLVVKAHS